MNDKDNELFKTQNFNEILNSNNPVLISKINYTYFIKQSDEVIEKVIKICYGKVDNDNDLKFLNSAIYNDKDIVFKILDKYNYDYNKKLFSNNSHLYKAHKCIKYFTTI